MIVEETAIPILPNKNAIAKRGIFLITNDVNNIPNRMVITKFMRNTRSKLNINLPEKTVDGDAINCRVIVVPRSSSETNALDNPDIAEKKITTHNNPPVKYSVIFSLPIENIITLIVTRINIASALTA
jgi:hypothetical protein